MATTLWRRSSNGPRRRLPCCPGAVQGAQGTVGTLPGQCWERGS